jgi:8-oxo-dGTP pyrophosphatase MutT (NUDIX family)
MKIMTQSSAVRHTAVQWDSTTTLLTANPVPAGREAVWAEALAFLDAGHRDGAHLVASVLVVDDGGLVLLAHHHRYRQWGPPGGHLDSSDGSLCAAAARELLEEAGLAAHVHPAPIDVRLSSYQCRTVTEPVLHLDVGFVAFATASAPALVASDELTGLEWFATHDLPAPLTPATAELVGLATAADALRG